LILGVGPQQLILKRDYFCIREMVKNYFCSSARPSVTARSCTGAAPPACKPPRTTSSAPFGTTARDPAPYPTTGVTPCGRERERGGGGGKGRKKGKERERKKGKIIMGKEKRKGNKKEKIRKKK
jgi:hypothetical protein